jgi:threonine dehydrogenase-like Zn-dependent dehydrogenase
MKAELVRLARTGALDPARLLSHKEPLAAAIEAYRAFDTRQPGWLKVELEPLAAAAPAA